ncbi:MAG: UDP-3-O-(3-hydroxymyristoyl)glucosamine N-acyltransferase [Acidobacteriota bacterium]
MKLGEIAKLLAGDLEGDENLEIEGINTLDAARTGQLSFFTNRKYFKQAQETKASAIIVDRNCPALDKPLIRHRNAYHCFAKAIELFYPRQILSGVIHPTAIISPEAQLGEQVYVGPYCTIAEGAVIGDQVILESHISIQKNVQIGKNSAIHSGCHIREGVIIGANCKIQSNTIIGSDGFGYAKLEDGSWYPISQVGTVIIEDDVEIGAGTTIDRATLGETRIKQGARIDNLVHLGHGCSIDQNSLICAQVGLAGSTQVGKNVILAGQVGAAGHLSIGDNVIAIAQTGIPHSISADTTISGSPAINQRLWLKTSAIIPKLPDLLRTVKELEKRLNSVERQLK